VVLHLLAFFLHERTPRPPVAAQLRVVFSPHPTVALSIHSLPVWFCTCLRFSCTNVRRARRSRLNFVLSFSLTQRLRSTSIACRHGFAPAFFYVKCAALQQAATGGRGLLLLAVTLNIPLSAGVVLRLRFSCTKRRYYNRPRPAGAAYWVCVLPLGRARRSRLTGACCYLQHPVVCRCGFAPVFFLHERTPRPAGAAYWHLIPQAATGGCGLPQPRPGFSFSY